jgi:L-arabinose isomerase
MTHPLRIGLYAYGPQFVCLKGRLEGYLDRLANKLVRPVKVNHGKVGRGVSIEMAVKHGLVTLVCTEPGPIFEIGTTKSRYRSPWGADDFVKRWKADDPAHHCAVGVNCFGDKITKPEQLLGLKTMKVC